MKGMHQLNLRFESAGQENLFISEITLAELKYGVENSERKEKNRKTLENFLATMKIVPIFHAIDLYAKEKARLKKSGISIDDFDLLIGVTVIANKLVMVTNNTSHFQRIHKIILEDWTKN